MSRRRIWLGTFLAIVFTAAAPSPVRCDLKGVSARKLNWSQFISKDPAYLYLSFTQKFFAPAAVVTWLHPTEQRGGSYWETPEPNHEQEVRAFAFRLIRETPEGYEVSFQPIGPKTKRPLQVRDTRIFFPRSASKPTSLTSQTSVVGFYGNPQQRPPW
jgi:hypothetical protein